MTGFVPDPQLVKHFCRCGRFFASHTAWFLHRDPPRAGCREIGYREWVKRYAPRPAAA